MATKTRIEVNTNYYEWNYGHRPRGRGSWAFKFRRADGRYVEHPRHAERTDIYGGTELMYAFWCPGSRLYGEAKKWAVEHARAWGAVEVIVLP